MKETDIDNVLQLQTKYSVLSLGPSKLKYGHDWFKFETSQLKLS